MTHILLVSEVEEEENCYIQGAESVSSVLSQEPEVGSLLPEACLEIGHVISKMQVLTKN